MKITFILPLLALIYKQKYSAPDYHSLHMDTNLSVLRSAKHFLLGTVLSRFSGLIRDMAMAFCFGSAPEVAGFMVAYRLANLFRRLLGEGNLAAGFVPAYEQRRAEGERAAALFYRDAAWSMGIVLIGAVLLMEGGLWVIARSVGGDWEEIGELAMWMAPGLFFICLFALHSALLQCHKKAFWSGVAPTAFNFAWVVAAFVSWHSSYPMRTLSMGITAAYGMQWLLTGRQIRRGGLSWSEWMRPSLFSSQWRAMIRPMTLGLVGVGAMQINSALDAIFARIADPSGPAFLWYAIRIQQLPMALFGVALSAALLPPLARAIKQGDEENYKTLLAGAIKNIIILMIPCTFGLVALGRPGLNLLYGQGDFTSADIDSTLYCLWAYGIGLVPSVLVLITAQGFYARKSYVVPTFASLAAVFVNVALNAWLVFGLHWGAASIALATSASSIANCWILFRSLQESDLFSPLFWRLSLVSLLAVAISLSIQSVSPFHGRAKIEQLIEMSLAAASYAGPIVWLLRKEILELLKARVENPR